MSVHRAINVHPAPGGGLDPPVWLPTDGTVGWADQHVHRDEPIDLGGFLFAEVGVFYFLTLRWRMGVMWGHFEIFGRCSFHLRH